MQSLMVVGFIVEEILNIDVKCVKGTGAQNIGHLVDTCRVSTSRRSTMQGLMVVGLIVEEISNVDTKYVKVTGAQNIGQGHQVKVPVKSVHLGEALCKVW